MELVNSWDDILDNILLLQKYRKSKNIDEVVYYHNLILRGTCFLTTKIDKNIVFAPSRFIGYRNNSISKHVANKTKDGRITNPEIERITNSKFLADDSIERSYLEFCISLGLSPREKGSFGVRRKYISKNIPTILSDDFLLDDINDIENQQNISETERELLTNARLGQGHFRESLIKYWKGCSCTGCKEFTLLRASHIKPWRLCNNQERLDPYNGLLLVPNLDLAFDNGLITFSGNGNIIISTELKSVDSNLLGITKTLKVKLQSKHKPYIKYHSENIFKK